METGNTSEMKQLTMAEAILELEHRRGTHEVYTDEYIEAMSDLLQRGWTEGAVRKSDGALFFRASAAGMKATKAMHDLGIWGKLVNTWSP
jgi:hypothetical protein